MTIDQWERLPWWQQRVYEEGLERQAEAARRQQGRAGQRRAPGGGSGKTKLKDTDRWKARQGATPAAASGDAGLASMGFDIR